MVVFVVNSLLFFGYFIERFGVCGVFVFLFLWFVGFNEVYYVDVVLEVVVGGNILVVSWWCDVVGEVEVVICVFKVYV